MRQPTLYYAHLNLLHVCPMTLGIADQHVDVARSGEEIYTIHNNTFSIRDFNFNNPQPPYYKSYAEAKDVVLAEIQVFIAEMDQVDDTNDPNPENITLWMAHDSFNRPEIVKMVFLPERLTYHPFFSDCDPHTCELPENRFRTKAEAVVYMNNYLDRIIARI